MLTRLSIATWNLERPSVRSWKRLPAIRSCMATVSADCWVLTETRTSIAPGNDYRGVHSRAHPSRRPDPDERWVSVWSRWPIRPIPIRASPWSATAIVEAEFGPMIVHGLVLPYQLEPSADGGRASHWTEFSKEVARQAQDWGALRREYASIPVVVAGDLNQSLDGSDWYGTVATRQLLCNALDDAGLRCLTKDDAVASGKLRRKHLVDHICVSSEFRGAFDIECWESVRSDGTRMSDHPGVIARLER
jgi:endonuclease/exonuclease/phosphatase family metal-dependent hydrolase